MWQGSPTQNTWSDLNRHFSQCIYKWPITTRKKQFDYKIKLTCWVSSFKKKMKNSVRPMWSHACVMPALGRLGQELKISLENIANPCLKNKSKVHRPVCAHENTHTQGAPENRENLEPECSAHGNRKWKCRFRGFGKSGNGCLGCKVSSMQEKRV